MAGLIADSSRAARFVFALRRQGITDKRILAALEAISRASFVPSALTGLGDADCVVPIACGQSIPRPIVTAHLLMALDLSPGGRERILLIGSGSGYTGALLARLGRYVYGVERYASLVLEARKRLARLGIDNVSFYHGDGLAGLEAHAPFDRIILAGAVRHVPDVLIQQLATGGRLVAAVESDDGVQMLKTMTSAPQSAPSCDGDRLPEPLVRLQPGIAHVL